MAMPKGKKFDNGYCSISTNPLAKNFRQISVTCAEEGMKIGPSNVRNVLLSAMKKIAIPICAVNAVHMSDEQLLEVARNPYFQTGVAALLDEEKNR